MDIHDEVSTTLDDDLVFQVLDLTDRDMRTPVTDEVNEEKRKRIAEGTTSYQEEFPFAYHIQMSGVTREGFPVTMLVSGFHPFLYIRVPDKGTVEHTMTLLSKVCKGDFHGIHSYVREDNKTVKKFIELSELAIRIENRALWTEDDDFDEDDELEQLELSVRQAVSKSSSQKANPTYTIQRLLSGVIWPPTVVRRKDLYWYKGEDFKETYLRVEFTTKSSLYGLKKILLDGKSRPTPITLRKGSSPISFNLYEANLEPTLRFIHATNMNACGWVSFPAGTWSHLPSKRRESESESESESDSPTYIIHAMCDDYTEIQTDIPDHGVAPLVIASFDIECDSSHGDFPMAHKKWEREVLLLSTLKGTPTRKIRDALREAMYGSDADESISAPFNAVYLVNPPKKGNDDDAVKLEKWITDALIEKVMAAVSKKQKEHAKNILQKAMPSWAKGICGDPIIQIGTTFHRGGEIIGRHIVTLGTCDASGVPGTEVVEAVQEEDVIYEWAEAIQRADPDIVTGYNITLFDMGYIYDRCQVLNIEEGIFGKHARYSMARYPNSGARFRASRLSSAAYGDNFLKTIEMPGRVILDLCTTIRRNFPSLSSYSLDSVAQQFLSGKVTGITNASDGDNRLVVSTNTLYGITCGGYVHACDDEGEDIGGKLRVVSMGPDTFTVACPDDETAEEVRVKTCKWTQAKDDVPPSEIFRLQKGDAKDRAIVAKYCIQDCDLVLRLLQKLDLVPNAIAMGTVCSVPLSYIFTRGQTIKSASLLFRECEKVGLIVPVLPAPTWAEMNDSYEGAVVLEPKTGLYLEEPVAVLDYSSLYPSSMISENISHDSIVAIWDRDVKGDVVRVQGNGTYADSLEEGSYVDIAFDRYEPDPEDERKNPVKILVGTRTCRFVQFEDGRKGIVGTILQQLLKKRKETKRLMKTEKDPFKRGLLNARQLAYKVTANSLYGALGAKNCKIRFQDLAASTTAYGRKLLNYAREGLERLYGRGARADCDAKYVYGDTDSVFVKFCPKDADGNPLRGKDALIKTIELAKEAEVALSAPLRAPHFLEYEKTFYPFMLFSKKRYIGLKYETDPDTCTQANMGVVLKRRDNAPIVKEIYQAVVDTILRERNLEKSITVAKDILHRLVTGEYGLKKLTITKSLRAHYANPDSIAHKVLAERIGERDPGNKPKSNDRVAYVYFDSYKTRNSKRQGDRIETPEFMVANKLTPDYKHYVTNQIQKPLTQLYALFWSSVPQSSKSVSEKTLRLKRMRAKQDPTCTEEKIERQITNAIAKDIERVVFADSIRRSVSKGRTGPMDSFLTVVKRPGGIS